MVRDLYEDVLGRPADPGGLLAHVMALNRGWRSEDVFAALAGSQEYAQRV
jgi:hypothetical protein